METVTALAIFTLDGEFYSWKIGRDTTPERMFRNASSRYIPDGDAAEVLAKAQSATFYVDPIRRSEAWRKAEDWIAAFGTPSAE